MRKQKLATMVTCLALVGAVTIGGTLALLTANSNTVTNTFTVGNGYSSLALTLDEAPVSQVTSGASNYGGYAATTDSRVEANSYTQLVKGTTLAKDPTFHLAAEQPTSWVVAKITGMNASLPCTGIAADCNWYKIDAAAGTYTKVTAASQITDGYYVYGAQVAAGASTQALFTQLSVNELPASSTTPVVVSGVAVEALTSGGTDLSAAFPAVWAAAQPVLG